MPSSERSKREILLRAGPVGIFLLVARILLFAAWLIAMVVLHLCWRALRLRSPWPKRFLGGTARISGVRIRCNGKVPVGQALFLSNHLSWLDIPVLAGAMGTAFVAHDGLGGSRFFRWLAEMNHTIFVSRTDRMAVGRQIEEIRTMLLAGHNLTIFPEGTTGDGTALLPFKPPLLKVVDPPPPRVRVIPIWLDYGVDAPSIAWFDDEPGLRNILRVLTRTRMIECKVNILPALEAEETGGRKQMASHAREVIAAAQAAGIGEASHV